MLLIRKFSIFLLLICTSCSSILFYPTGIENEDGMGYIYQSINRKGAPNKPPELYFCHCELELRKKQVFIKGTNELVE
jgi:hypothetical protein